MGQVLAHLILLPNQQKKKREAEGLPRLCSGIMQDRTPSTWSPGLPALGRGGGEEGGRLSMEEAGSQPSLPRGHNDPVGHNSWQSPQPQ